ncbi:MAG: S9 family peptidase [Gammaproteobacteria bacterium]|nr:S9 family peptidase [Gammaproteobacteria bacterium]
MSRLPTLVLALSAGCLASGAALATRPLLPEDWFRFEAVSDLKIAPDGAAVAYLVTSFDRDSDESRSALWLADWAGNESVQLTRGESASEPRFSPDGKYLSFLAARPEGNTTQLWLLDRRGGEPRPLSHVSEEISSYQWSPDGQHLVLVMHAAEDPKAPKSPRPRVLDTYKFKQDKDGYLTAEMRTHLYLLDVSSGACQPLAAEPLRADSLPAFSPDGRQIAFVGNSAAARDAGFDEIYLVGTAPAAQPRRLLRVFSPNHQQLEWSPDGAALAFLEGDELKYNAYIMDKLALADPSSGRVRLLTGGLDRAVVSPHFAGAGSIEFAVEDDGRQYPVRLTLASGAIEHLAGPVVVHELATAAGHTAVLASSDTAPIEVFALEGGRLRPLSAHNRALFTELSLGTVEDIRFPSGSTEIHGQLVKPPGFVAGRRYPTILWIHGGPNGQDDHSLLLESYSPPLERQLFASHGYLVLAVNYRGGTGRGAKFARAIFADWGHKEVEDLLAGVDYAVGAGLADPSRLGVGGWSYGGLLTDYLIASTARFKAAIAGAGSGNQLSTFGADEYVVQYNAELGPPWRNPAVWLRVSYPFFRADRIRTPTLFLGGDKDFNVPIIGGEQMYQALQVLGVPSQLIVYPGEYHSLTRPSFLVDRYRRYLDWMAKYVGGGR